MDARPERVVVFRLGQAFLAEGDRGREVVVPRPREQQQKLGAL
jgi:hypothetical protein